MLEAEGMSYWTGCKCHDACNERFFWDHRREFEHPPILAMRGDAELPPTNWKSRAIATGTLAPVQECKVDKRPHYHVS